MKVKCDHRSKFSNLSTSFHCTGRYELNKLTSLPMCGFIAQLVEHRTGIAEVSGFVSCRSPDFFRLLLYNCLNWKIYCDDHISLSNLLISARPQRQTNAEGCRIFGDLDQLKSKDTIQNTVDWEVFLVIISMCIFSYRIISNSLVSHSQWTAVSFGVGRWALMVWSRQASS